MSEKDKSTRGNASQFFDAVAWPDIEHVPKSTGQIDGRWRPSQDPS